MAGEIAWWVSVLIGAGSAGSVKLVESVIGQVFDARNRLSDARDSDVDAIRSVAFEVRDLAKIYWTNSGKDATIEGAISGRLLFIGATIDELFEKNLPLLQDGQVLMNRFDRACTEGDFGSTSRKSEAGRSSMIESSAYTLIHNISKSRRKL